MLAVSAADNLTVTLPQTSCCVKQNQDRGNGNRHFIYIYIFNSTTRAGERMVADPVDQCQKL